MTSLSVRNAKNILAQSDQKIICDAHVLCTGFWRVLLCAIDPRSPIPELVCHHRLPRQCLPQSILQNAARGKDWMGPLRSQICYIMLSSNRDQNDQSWRRTIGWNNFLLHNVYWHWCWLRSQVPIFNDNDRCQDGFKSDPEPRYDWKTVVPMHFLTRCTSGNLLSWHSISPVSALQCPHVSPLPCLELRWSSAQLHHLRLVHARPDAAGMSPQRLV